MEVRKSKKYILEYNLQWFGGDGGGGEKTEPATQKKLDDARKEGKVSKSKDLTEAFQLVVLFLLLKIFMGYVGEELIAVFSVCLGRTAEFMEVNHFPVFSSPRISSSVIRICKSTHTSFVSIINCWSSKPCHLE